MVEINKQLFNKLVLNPNSISLDESIYMKDLIKKYPYFQVAKVIELIGFKKFDNIKFKNALKNTSIYSSNRSILHDVIEHNKIKLKENSDPVKDFIYTNEINKRIPITIICILSVNIDALKPPYKV